MLKTELQGSIQKMNDLEKLKKNIEMTVTAEGLRIELLESRKGTFFESGSSHPRKRPGILESAGGGNGQTAQQDSIEGHTDAKPFAATALRQLGILADRANAARRLMQRRLARRPGLASSRLRRSETPQSEGSARCIQPAHLDHRPVHQYRSRRSRNPRLRTLKTQSRKNRPREQSRNRKQPERKKRRTEKIRLATRTSLENCFLVLDVTSY